MSGKNRTGKFNKSNSFKGRRSNDRQNSNIMQIAIPEAEEDFKRELALCRHEVSQLQGRAATWQNRYEKLYCAYRTYEQRRAAICQQYAKPAQLAPPTQPSTSVDAKKTSNPAPPEQKAGEKVVQMDQSGAEFIKSLGLSSDEEEKK